MTTNIDLDKFDRLILNQVQLNNRVSTEALGIEVGLSTASVQRRLKRLRSTAVITDDVSVVDRSKLGYSLQLLVQVSMVREDLETLGDFRKHARQYKCIQQLFYVTGEYDFLLIIVARDMSHFESVAKQLFLDNPDIKSFTTSVVMGESEQSLMVPA